MAEDATKSPRAPKRANGDGTAIRTRADGVFFAAITDHGKRRWFYGKTERAVRDKLRAARRRMDANQPAIPERITVAAFLDRWHETVRPQLRYWTWVSYGSLLRLHINPAIGTLQLGKLTALDLQALYADRLAAGLSANTVGHIHALLHAALQQAERWQMLPVSPARHAVPPRIERYEFRPLTPLETRTLLAAATTDRLAALYVLATTTGMRQGELLGLHWRDVDLESGTVHVRVTLQQGEGGYVLGEPKTKRSRRSIPLAPMAIDALRTHHTQQQVERQQAGPDWQDNDLVFTDETGHWVEPSTLRRRSWLPLLARSGVPRVRFHDLRHGCASFLAAEGIPLHLISRLLGHATTAITVNTYVHGRDDELRALAAQMHALLGQPGDQR